MGVAVNILLFGEVATGPPSEGEPRDRPPTMNLQKALSAVAATLIGATILGAPVMAAASQLGACPVEATTTEIAKPLKCKKL